MSRKKGREVNAIICVELGGTSCVSEEHVELQRLRQILVLAWNRQGHVRLICDTIRLLRSILPVANQPRDEQVQNAADAE